ncbi:MAG: valine--tRNA ligase [Desulfobacteraceae bacterium]|nr:MAG: valine--tRNA ligase [Desulfobacteraceae bacterium]
MSSGLIDKSYEPHDVEKKWYAIWEERKLFAADEAGDRKPFSIVIPPPNVTGVLHMGHALNNTMQDILCRYRRLKGDNVLWMPGTDHAGIATQNVVERKLASQGTDRQQLGREKFVEAVWRWREESGSAIINQLKRLGASCDWDRERFTMDEGLSLAVRKVFVQLYKEGLIYRGDYIINWCPRCRTALSDLEVDHDEQEGRLYHIRYPFPGSTEGLVVATTRPETMLGDTAVAIHPDDERYFNIPAKEVVLPLTGRIIPVIRDTYVEMAFGTGALKVTPAHDPNDFQIGIRHNLSSIKVINDDGNMAQEAGSQFEGMDRFACREAVVAALKEQGLLERMEQHNHSVGNCYRCKTVVEPNLSKQWFVKATPLAKKAIAAVEDGRTRIIPESWTKTYYEWMYNIKDWCISRQIWWGHQIPAWTCGKCSRLMVEMDDPSTCESCGSSELVRETDVLDTWFSSALWPFSTMGWPDKTPLLKTFYPTSVLITGFDILFFWVARMMMMGIHFMEEVPFRDVYVHALVRDEHGKKMSKSKGNVIDPLEVIEKYGTDAFRFTLAAFAAMGRDIKLSEGRVEGYRHFINKLWNAVRFSLMHITEDPGAFDEEKISLADRWILSKNSLLTISVAESLDNYRFNEAAASLYRFVWHEFCDWYLEAVKPVLYGKKGEEEKAATIAVLWRVLKDTTVLLHPLIPFVTEEIWDKIPGTHDSIMKADYPDNRFEDPAAVSVMETIIGIITGIRNIRGEMNISPSRMLTATIHSDDQEKRELIGAHQEMVRNLARLESLNIAGSGERPRSAATSLVEGVTIFVSLEGVIDFSKEEERLAKEAGKVGLELSTVQKKLNNKGFMDKAPEEVVQKVRDQNDQLQEKLHKIQVNLEKIREIQNS